MDIETSQSSEHTILIVDDNPTNLGVIAGYLEDFGFITLVARDGESGLAKAVYAQPDLILLDVMMPGINGFETCRRLKEDPETEHIPVIFMTALSQIEHKVRGFRVGAVDYVTKPINQEEVLARINTHLKIRTLTRDLQVANDTLTKINADKDKFFSIVAHDLKGPFLPLLGNAEILANMALELDRQDVQAMSQTIHRSAERVLDLLNNLLQWSRLQMGRMEYKPIELDIQQIAQRNLQLLGDNAKEKQITLINQITEPCFIWGDIYMVDTIFRNLISNAVKFTHQHGTVTVSAKIQPKSLLEKTKATMLELIVEDNGVGLDADHQAKIFTIGTHHTTLGTAQEKGTGLGLIMCREMVERNGGTIWVNSEAGQGSRFTFTLPLIEIP